jgi:hypothetical protein
VDVIMKLVLSLRVPPESLQRILLHPDHPYLAVCLDAAEKRARFAGGGGEPDKPQRSMMMRWKTEHARVAGVIEAGRARQLERMDRESASTRWLDALPQRQREALYCTLERRKKCEATLTSVDLYQSIHRVFLGHNDILSTLLPHSRIWIVREHRLLTGLESMRAMGMPLGILEAAANAGTSDAVLRDLAGNAFCAPMRRLLLELSLSYGGWSPPASSVREYFLTYLSHSLRF